MVKKDITSLRGTIDFLKKQNELLAIKGEVDPVYEISGIQRALENGPALLFEQIKGYPGVRDIGNIFARKERIASIFNISDPKKIKFKCVEAMRNPISPIEVKEAPCQEVVITKDIDVMATLPLIKHTERDGGRFLGGGNTLVSGKYFGGGSHVSFNRMAFRTKNSGTIQFGQGLHLSSTYIRFRGQKIPLTINIGVPPAVTAVAATSFLMPLVPWGANELGFAGALQGSPVEIVKAKTVDAYAIASAEWVIEGYVDTVHRDWETEEAEKLGRGGVAPFFPEWPGYLGRAYKAPRFEVTAITHRKDRPIFFTPLAYSFEGDVAGTFFREACFLELAERIRPDFVVDVNTLIGVAGWGGNIIFQVKKTNRGSEGMQRRILSAALSSSQGLRLAIAVDDDVDIYSESDLLWAIATRVNPVKDLITGTGGGIGQLLMPSERMQGAVGTGDEVRFEGGLAIDATVPFEGKWNFERAKHPVGRVDLKKWISETDLAKIRSHQSEYARLLAERG